VSTSPRIANRRYKGASLLRWCGQIGYSNGELKSNLRRWLPQQSSGTQYSQEAHLWTLIPEFQAQWAHSECYPIRLLRVPSVPGHRLPGLAALRDLTWVILMHAMIHPS